MSKATVATLILASLALPGCVVGPGYGSEFYAAPVAPGYAAPGYAAPSGMPPTYAQPGDPGGA